MATKLQYRLFMVALILAIGIFVARGHSSEESSQQSNACRREDVENAPRCCKLPPAFPRQLVKNCTNVAQPQQTIRERRDNDLETVETAARRRRNPNNCISECVLRRQGVIANNSSKIDINKLGNVLYNASNANWRPVLNSTINQCWTKINSTGSTPPPHRGDCNPQSDILMMCILRGLAVRCPAAERVLSDFSCLARNARLRKCNPFVSPRN